MKFYLVGGAVRDNLLGLKSRDYDYVVLDSSRAELISRGFKPVGESFEVFIHPVTRDEYTLAYQNDLRLELHRRDLTINSIALDVATNSYFDPFCGLDDIKNKILRHTSIFFSTDPVRILRLARFKAQYPDFLIDEATVELCKQQSLDQNLFRDIAGERFLIELKKSMSLSNPFLFFELLRDWKVLDLFFKELADHYRDEVNWSRAMIILEKSCLLSHKFSVRFASLVRELPSAEIVISRFKLDRYTRKLSIAVNRNHVEVSKALELTPEELLILLLKLDALREGDLFEDAVLCCFVYGKDALEINREDNKYTQGNFLLQLCCKLKNKRIGDLASRYSGIELKLKIKELRLKIIKEFKQLYSSSEKL